MNVYCIHFPNGKKYVGVEAKNGRRKSQHSRAAYRDASQLVSRAIIKYGWENCRFEYLLEERPPEDCYELEKKLIAGGSLQNKKFGYNQSSGGEKGFLGVKMTQEHKNKIAKANLGKIVSIETREKQRQRMLQNPTTPEILKKIAETLRKNPPRLGAKLSEETKQKISKTLKGKGCGDKNPFFGKTHSAETKLKMKKSWAERRAKL